jgi:dual specificity phosphatase 12
MNYTTTNANLILESSNKTGALYLGNRFAANDEYFLTNNRITSILSVASAFELLHEKVDSYKQVMADDEDDYDLTQHFKECFEFIDEQRHSNKNVLVHCMAGVSRSAAIVVGYLKYTSPEKDFDHIHSQVKKSRPCIKINRGFIQQLESLFHSGHKKDILY